MKTTYQIDPAHSGVHFTIRHLMISKVRGAFPGVKGKIVHDADNPANTSIEAEIEVGSINTNDATRDGHLKTADFFDVAQYPLMKYQSTGVSKGDSHAYTVNGNLTMHGITKPVSLEVHEVSEETNDGWGKTRVGVTASGKLKRSDFNLASKEGVASSSAVLGDDINIEFDIQMVKQ